MWSHRIRDPLIWLGCADPCQTTAGAQANDPAVLTATAVMAQWKNHIGLNAEVTIQEAINHALKDGAHDLQLALLSIAQGRVGTAISPERLGRWLKKMEGRPIDGRVFRNVRMLHGYPIWVLRTVEEDQKMEQA